MRAGMTSSAICYDKDERDHVHRVTVHLSTRVYVNVRTDEAKPYQRSVLEAHQVDSHISEWKMKSILIALVVSFSVMTCYVDSMKLSKFVASKFLALKNRKVPLDSLCESCKTFLSVAVNVAEDSFSWLGQEISVLCEEDFLNNSTIVEACKMEAEAAVEKVQEYIALARDPDTICQKFYLC
uniref:Saposin B-type domain-containing protein n=1 Tax=Setaria digitata TaxID=48799 RepID=A0A915PIZ4_9BILA